MISGRAGPQTPAGLHGLISLVTGALAALCAREHKALQLIILVGTWAAFKIFMHARARRARGVFVDQNVYLFSWFGTAGFLAGLLFASAIFVLLR